MRARADLLLALILSPLSCSSADQCAESSGNYEGFRVVRVSVVTPLRFPIHWIERAMLGPALDSLHDVAMALPVQEGKTFRLIDHVNAAAALSNRYTVLRPGERMKLVFVVPKLVSCNQAERTIQVEYRVYATDAAYFASRLLESVRDRPDRKLAVGESSETRGKMITLPFGGYNRTQRGFGGIHSSWTGKGALLNSASIEAGGSSSSYRAGLSLGGSRDPGQGLFSHLEWKVGFRASEYPAGNQKLRATTGSAQFFAATRARGPLGVMFRFGASIEGGKRISEQSLPVVLADAPHRALKTFIGGTWNHNRHIWSASYGFQAGRGTDSVPVDYSKHLLDLAHQVRFLPREHWPIQLDSHFSEGWILGADSRIPAPERFFGGNLVRDFLDNPLWRIPADPLLRSIPQNRLNLVGPGKPIGGTRFAAVNLTLAFPAWRIPAVPTLIRNAKPLGDGIHFGMKLAQEESLKDYRARTSQFSKALRRAAEIAPDLETLRDRLSSLPTQGLPEDLTGELAELLDTYIKAALEDIKGAQARPTSGTSWAACRRLSKDDPDIFPLAHIHDNIESMVAPGLEAAGRVKEAGDLKALAEKIDRGRRDLAALLAPIESLVAASRTALEAFRPDLKFVTDHATHLKGMGIALQGEPAPLGSLAASAAEWSVALLNSAGQPDSEVDPFDTLYTLSRLIVGIGKLIPSQIESAIRAANQLAQALGKEGRPAESKAVAEAGSNLKEDLARLEPRLRSLQIPQGERWARQQNAYFVRALDVAFREMNLATVSPVVLCDAARIGPVQNGLPSFRYGIGPAVRLSIVTFQVTVGYSFNPSPRPWEPRGAFFFAMDVADLFR